MKKPILYILGGLLVVSLAGNATQFVAYQNQATENAAILADLQGQLDVATKDLSDAKTNLATLEQNHATLLADAVSLQAEIDATNQQAPVVIDTTQTEKPVPPPASSKPETSKPVTPPASSKPETSKPVTPPASSKPQTPPASSKPSGGGNTSSGGGGTDLFGRPLDPGDDLKEEDYATGGTYN